MNMSYLVTVVRDYLDPDVDYEVLSYADNWLELFMLGRLFQSRSFILRPT